MAKKDLSYKYDKCNCGEKKLKVSANCQRCRVYLRGSVSNCGGSKPVKCIDGECVQCKTLLNKNQKAFCSLECRHANARLKVKECLHCRQQFKPKASRIKYCANECANRHKAELYRNPDSKMQQSKTTVNGCKVGASCRLSYSLCIQCGGKRSTLRKLKHCSRKCERKEVHANRVKRGQYLHQSGEFVCHCGKKVSVKLRLKMRTTCSKECARTERRATRRAKIKSRRVDRGLNWRSAVKRFGWQCAFCRCECVKPVGINAANEATLDHIRPLSKGGTHTWDNVQVMCRKCNTLKGANENVTYDSSALTE